MEIISQIELARISDNHFVSIEEAREMVDKRNERWSEKRRPNRKILGEAYKSIALRYVQKQPRMRTCKLSEIESVAHVYKESFDRVLPDLAYYEIKARGKSFMLRPSHK